MIVEIVEQRGKILGKASRVSTGPVSGLAKTLQENYGARSVLTSNRVANTTKGITSFHQDFEPLVSFPKPSHIAGNFKLHIAEPACVRPTR